MEEYSKLNYDYLGQVLEIPYLIWWSLTRKKATRKPKRILIVNTCLIGDLTASLHSLRQFIINHPRAKIDLLVSTPMKRMMEKIKGVNMVYPAKSICNRRIDNTNLLKEREDITKNSYDLILIVRLSRDAHHVIQRLNAKEIQASPLSYFKYVLHLVKNIISRKRVKQYSAVNFEWVGEKPKYFTFEELFKFSESDYKKIREMDVMHGNAKKIIIHAGGGWRKQWENEKWVELLKRINKSGNYKFIFIGGENAEEENFEFIQNNLDFKIYSLIKKVDLAELLLVMRLSNYFIGIDSGPRNIAHLADLRSISLLGPGPKHFMPMNKNDIVIDKSACRCTHFFCFKDKPCIPKIKVDEVFNAFKKLVKS